MQREPREPTLVIREHLAEWETPFVELDVFGTADAAIIARTIDVLVRAQLGSGVAGYLCYGASVGSTHGVQLEDGRRVVVKVRPPAETNPDLALDRDALVQIVGLQRVLADAGFPCPMPLVGPVAVANGLATIERYVDVGEQRDAHAPEVRRLLALGLHAHMSILAPFVGTSGPTHFRVPDDRLFPQPHGRLFHPSDADEDTGWVRALARRARDIAEATMSPACLGHCDWRVEHVRFSGDEIVATYDWDSIARAPELRIVGVVAHGFTADWSQDAIRRVPTIDGILGFIADYEHARGRPFTAAEHRGARAWAVYSIAYGAWISIAPGTREWPADSWPALLRDCGEPLLR